MSWQPKILNRQQQEERRLEGCRLLVEGMMSQADIARHLHVSQVAVASGSSVSMSTMVIFRLFAPAMLRVLHRC